jgi:hypothetical protein
MVLLEKFTREGNLSNRRKNGCFNSTIVAAISGGGSDPDQPEDWRG